MIEKLYSKYFQKSKSFLFPLLGIKKNAHYTVENTYLEIPGVTAPEDVRLVCVYKRREEEGFLAFEQKMLLSNPLFHDRLQTKDHNIYIFNFRMHEQDFFTFLMGRYSKLSARLKKAVRDHYGEKTHEYQYMDSFLYPEKYFDTYSKLLDVDTELLKTVGELCDPCNLEKEILKISVEHLEKLPEVL